MDITNLSTDYIDEMFNTLASQETQKAQASMSALSLGLEFYQKKDYQRATGEFQRAIALDPLNVDSYNYLANSYLAQNKTREAIKAYTNSLAIAPYQDSVRVNLGNIYLQQKSYSLAEKEYKEAARLNPSNELAPYTLGQLYVQTERYDEAIAQFKKVQKIVPHDANPYYSLGMAYNKQGNYAEAVKQLKEAVRLKPKMAAAHLELGVAYAGLGDDVKARKEVSILKSINPAQGELLKQTIARPKILSGGGGPTDSFNYAYPYAGMELYLLDSALSTANVSKEFRMTFYFDSKMDPASVVDISNWTITRASGGAAGYYNNLLPVLPTEAYIPQNPISVAYDSQSQSATLTFMLSQNETNDATIDPSKIVFKFSGKDITGHAMDPSADEFDGFAQRSF
jgi:tetratricopeptide (TPR) repeat protein